MSKAMLMAMSMAAVGATGCGGGNRAERMEKMVQWRVDDALDELEATQPQRERVQQLTKDTLLKSKPIIEQAQSSRTELLTQWKAAVPDSVRVHQVIDAQLDTVRVFAHHLADSAIEVHQLLTVKQRDEVSERLDRLEKRSRR
jgi:Spy/CpxP family protein refolding chaperone